MYEIDGVLPTKYSFIFQIVYNFYGQSASIFCRFIHAVL